MKTLEWHTERNVCGDRRWSALNDFTGKWDTYDICVMENGEYRVWGLLVNPAQPQGKRYTSSLAKAKAIAEDDYQRRQRAEAWREYTETHDPPDVKKVPPLPLLIQEVYLDLSGWARYPEAAEYARRRNISLGDAILTMANSGLSHYQGTPLTERKP